MKFEESSMPNNHESLLSMYIDCNENIHGGCQADIEIKQKTNKYPLIMKKKN
jgi:hypothetical protein